MEYIRTLCPTQSVQQHLRGIQGIIGPWTLLRRRTRYAAYKKACQEAHAHHESASGLGWAKVAECLIGIPHHIRIGRFPEPRQNR